MNRRSFLRGIVAAPAVILTPGLLMPVKSLAKPTLVVFGATSIECRAMTASEILFRQEQARAHYELMWREIAESFYPVARWQRMPEEQYGRGGILVLPEPVSILGA